MLIVTAIWTGCNSSSRKGVSDSLSNNKASIVVTASEQKAIDAQMAEGDRPDSEQTYPSQTDEKNRILKSYDDVLTIDTVMVNGVDSLHFHLKYYCLKNTTIVVPKSYDVENKTPIEFSTHEFASDIYLVNKKDTVLKKQFTSSNFNHSYTDAFGGNLKKYGTILMPDLSLRNKDKSKIVLAYSIAIPTTDIGRNVYLIISKNGSYKIAEDF